MKNIKSIKETERANIKAQLSNILKEYKKTIPRAKTIDEEVEFVKTQIEFEKEFNERKS